ncbi:MAG TPA: CopD family protein [Steroidobacteraceae bacterium]|jgi:Putative copper export protein|nr:CopD family protein [Steroidobacteraceae bacterium]
MLEALAVLLKVALYAGLLSASGAVFAQATLRPLPDEVAYLTRIARRGALFIIGVSPLIALVLIWRLGGAFDDATLSAVFVSNSGAALALQVTGAALLLTSSSEDSVLLRLSYALLPMLGFAFSGHAAGIGPVEGLVAVVHVSMAAWWLGSLFYLRRECVHAQFDRLVTVLTRFSSIAFVLAGVLVMGGLALVMILVDFSNDPWLSLYGQILGGKLCVVAVLLALAGYNRRRLTPRLLARDGTAVQALRLTTSVELALIATVLTITAILTTYASPHD